MIWTPWPLRQPPFPQQKLSMRRGTGGLGGVTGRLRSPIRIPSAFDLAMAYLGVVLAPVDALIGRLGFVYDDSSNYSRLLSYACSSAALSAPLLVFGLVGGYLTRYFDIWLARGAWFTPGR